MQRLTPVINGLLTKPLDFSHFFDEVPVGIALLDLDARVVYLNRAMEALTGFSVSAAYGLPCRNVLRSSACVTTCPVKSVEMDSQPVSVESDIINCDRQRIPVRMTISPVLDTEGTITGYVETLEDLRNVKTVEAKKHMAYSFADIIGRSSQMERLFQTIPVLAQSDVSIMVTGETGTGKDLVAEAVHQTSNRASGPFVKINCGALPETLLESEIFGHQKGAFTGATEDKPGRFRLAHNGTIFLTEIGDLPLPLQVKLLTFLDDKVIYPLGGTKGIHVDVRIIVATHRDLEQMVQDGQFRQDLLFRLNVARIHLPPLSERDGDIRLLLDHFLASFSQQLGRTITGFTDEAGKFLLTYHYSGNIRELRNIVEYAANISSDPLIGLNDLPAYLFENRQLRRVVEGQSLSETEMRQVSYDAKPNTWAQAEKDMIINALLSTRGKKTRAAELLGWGRSTLWRKMKQYGLDN